MAAQVSLCALWGLGQVIIKIAGQGITPMFHAGVRSLGATILVLLWMSLRQANFSMPKAARGPIALAGLLFAFEFLFLFEGIARTTAARATLLLYTAPFFVALGLHFRLPSERLSKTRWLGMLLAFAGVLLAFLDRLGSMESASFAGDILCILGAICWAATTIVMKTTALRQVGPELNLAVQLGCSALLLLLLSQIAGEAGLINPSPLVLSLIAVQIVAIASFSYLCWFHLIGRYNAAVLHTFTFLTPVFGMFFAWAILDEPIGLKLVAALGLVATGIVLVNQRG
jgi:drug/metabolite transporter (DMT)-like permease